jgi:two-component system, cell cycle sensor histidine kinase DivJ
LISFLDSFAWRFAPWIRLGVNPSSPDRAQRYSFIYARLVASLLAIAITPIYLASFGAPDLWASCAIVWLILPLAAIVHVAGTGRIVEAQSISLASLLILAAIVSFGAGGSHELIFAWVVLAPLEAAISRSAALLVAAGFFVSTILFGIVGAEYWGLIQNQPLPASMTAALAAPAALYALILAVAALDIHRRRHEVETKTNENYRVLADAIGDLVLRHDPNGNVISTSGGAESLFQAAAPDLVGRGFFDRVHVADRPAFLQTLAEAQKSDEAVATTLRLRIASHNGHIDEPCFAWVEMRARRFAGANGPCDIDGAAVISVVRDVTKAKTYEANLESARSDAEIANSWKDRLLANVSHELRTPLNAIIGFSEILSSPALAPRDPDRQLEYAGIIHASAEHLLSVVNLVLDASKIEAGQFELLPEPFDVATLIGACCDMVCLKADKGRVDLVRGPIDCPAELIADKRACRQIVLNLLSNAIKFTPPEGKVTIGAQAGPTTLTITVQDTGIGIAQDQLSRLGDRFFQVRSDADRLFEGTGLGLSVVRGLVGLHGGSMSLESAAGEGTRVIVRLPLDCRPTARSDAPPARLEASVSSPFHLDMKEKKIA